MTDANPAADSDAGSASDDVLGAADAELAAIAEDARAALARAMAAVATVGKGRAAWGTATMALAGKLKRGRELNQNDDRAFGEWLQANRLDSISRDDREALLNMARHSEIATATLATTERLSWQNVWRKEIRPKLKLKNTSRTHTEGGKGGRRGNKRPDTEPPPIVARLKAFVRDAEKTCDWCKNQIKIRFPYTTENARELEHEVEVKLLEQVSEFYGGDDNLVKAAYELRERRTAQ
jgi:hypothetical protein